MMLGASLQRPQLRALSLCADAAQIWGGDKRTPTPEKVGGGRPVPVCSHGVPIPGVIALQPREGAAGFLPPHPGPHLTPASPSPASVIMTGAYNNFFRMFDRNTKRDVTLEASRESSKPRAVLKPRRVCVGGKRRRDDISVDSLDFTKKILHTAWHPAENIIAIAATNNLYIFQDKVNSDMH